MSSVRFLENSRDVGVGWGRTVASWMAEVRRRVTVRRRSPCRAAPTGVRGRMAPPSAAPIDAGDNDLDSEAQDLAHGGVPFLERYGLKPRPCGRGGEIAPSSSSSASDAR